MYECESKSARGGVKIIFGEHIFHKNNYLRTYKNVI